MKEWTEDTPTVPGVYAFQKRGEWPIRICHVEKGNWRLAEDPERLYGNGKPMSDLYGKWLGPLPPISKPGGTK